MVEEGVVSLAGEKVGAGEARRGGVRNPCFSGISDWRKRKRKMIRDTIKSVSHERVQLPYKGSIWRWQKMT